jgi:hypothetical protein
VEYLKNSHFAPIDIPLIHGIISLLVQQYYCYRIWTLNTGRRSSWLCLIISVVCLSALPYPKLPNFAWIKLSVLQSIGGLWGGIRASLVQIIFVKGLTHRMV